MAVDKTKLKNLLDDRNIVIVGPDFKKPNKLRVYANGGLIGRVYVGTSKSGKHNLISADYYSGKHVYNANLKPTIGKLQKNVNDNLSILTNTNYITEAKSAVEERFGDKKNSNFDKKERYVETKIVKSFIDSNENWAVIDMEVQLPRNWFNGHNFSKNTTKQPRFDIVVINDSGIGILELKVNNDNADNLNSHYEHMNFIMKNKKKEFLKEMERRLTLLEENGLVSEYAKEHYKDYVKSEKLWCGFLFVGGNKDDSSELVADLENKQNINKFKFIYYRKTEDIRGLDINKTQNFSEFKTKNN